MCVDIVQHLSKVDHVCSVSKSERWCDYTQFLSIGLAVKFLSDDNCKNIATHIYIAKSNQKFKSLKKMSFDQ